MIKNNPWFVPFLALLAISLACGTTTSSAPTATIDQHAIETMVAATMAVAEVTSQESAAQDTEAEAEAESEPEATKPAPTDIPTIAAVCTPQHPGAQSLPQPTGFGSSINTLAIQFFDSNGNVIGNKQTAGMTWLDPNQIHIGGSLSQGLESISLVYYSLENGGILKRSENGIANQLALAPNLVTLTGAEGGSDITYSTNDSDQAAGGWVSYLYAGDLEAINGAVPMVTHSEGNGFVIYPLAVGIESGIAHGVWYTLSLWGIGNINFSPFNGLYYYNFYEGQVIEFLPSTERLAGFSPDQTLVAYVPGAGGEAEQPGGPGNFFTLRNLITCQEFAIPFNLNTNLGAGFVTFSPDNQYLAWLEASGPNNMEAQMRLRIAKTNGDILRDAQYQELSNLAGGETPTYIKPVGWLTNHLLLLEIGVPAQIAPLIVVWAPDSVQPLNPALGANQSALLAEGVFAGFLYP